MTLKLAIFISGRGSNMKALVQACESPDFPAEVVLVLSNKADAAGLEYARDKAIATAIVAHKDFESKQKFETALLETVKPYGADLICLAGFMRLLSPHFLDGWHETGGQIINIHPSLLPKYKGLDTHARAIAAGDKESGCSVHFVIPEMDAGEILVQKTVPILVDDTPESLAKRILKQEHIAYPEAVDRLAAGH
jgi:phosphoribosylglycinamide formyltransferase-1